MQSLAWRNYILKSKIQRGWGGAEAQRREATCPKSDNSLVAAAKIESEPASSHTGVTGSHSLLDWLLWNKSSFTEMRHTTHIAANLFHAEVFSYLLNCRFPLDVWSWIVNLSLLTIRLLFLVVFHESLSSSPWNPRCLQMAIWKSVFYKTLYKFLVFSIFLIFTLNTNSCRNSEPPHFLSSSFDYSKWNNWNFHAEWKLWKRIKVNFEQFLQHLRNVESKLHPS